MNFACRPDTRLGRMTAQGFGNFRSVHWIKSISLVCCDGTNNLREGSAVNVGVEHQRLSSKRIVKLP